MKPIPGYEGLYSITKDGKIWSHKRNKFLKKHLTQHGYYRSPLFKKGRYTKKHDHQWVMLTYVGPSNGRDVNHINSNKLDNRIENLEYITRKENIRHAILSGTNKIKGEDSKKSKIKESDARKIKYKLKNLNNSEVAKIYGISKTAVWLIRNGKNWAHV